MRTTIDIDNDILKNLKERAREEGISLRGVVNAALRRGLEAFGKRPNTKPYRCRTFSMGAPVAPFINLDKALAVAEALEDLETARELEARK